MNGSIRSSEILRGINPSVEVFSKACPLFVPFVEEGPEWWGHEAAKIIAREYLGMLRGTGIDALVLGCTHYPLLSGVIGEAVGPGIELVSSAQAVAAEVAGTLGRLGIKRGPDVQDADTFCGPPEITFYTSDSPEKFKPFCRAILEDSTEARVSKLDIEKYESRLT